MPPTLAVTLPARHRDVVLDTTFDRYAAHARALAEALARFRAGRGPLSAVLDAREDLAEVDALLDLLGWARADDGEAVELVGPPALVRDVVRGALSGAARRLGRDVDRYERAEISSSALREAGALVMDTLGAFLRLEAAAP